MVTVPSYGGLNACDCVHCVRIQEYHSQLWTRDCHKYTDNIPVHELCCG